MKKIKAEELSAINDLLLKLNFCHDASLRKIIFLKEREFNRDGSLVYPYADSVEFINCDIEMELLLNSFKGAKKKQIIVLKFDNVTSFYFQQKTDVDYSDIYEVKCEQRDHEKFEFKFYSTRNKINSLSLLGKCLIAKII